MAGWKIWALAAAVLLLAGCGGGRAPLAKAAYQQKMQIEAQRLTDALQGANLASANSLKDFAARIGSVKAEIKRAADTVGALRPPKDAEADTQKIADVLHRFVALVDRIQQAAAKGDLAGVRRFVAELQSEGKNVQPAISDLKRKGYDVGKFG
jgi:predicted component of type VI protein secretion system